MSGDDGRFSVTLRRKEGYQFGVEFENPSHPELLMDEPTPLGDDAGPNATRVLAAAMGDCLGASLLFCLEKAKVPVHDLRIRVEGTLTRNEKGRLRIGEIRVALEPLLGEELPERAKRCVELFEDYCIVTGSVREGIPVSVEVKPRAESVEDWALVGGPL